MRWVHCTSSDIYCILSVSPDNTYHGVQSQINNAFQSFSLFIPVFECYISIYMKDIDAVRSQFNS